MKFIVPAMFSGMATIAIIAGFEIHNLWLSIVIGVLCGISTTVIILNL